MLRAGARTYLFTIGGLVANLIGGVVIARALGPADRGAITAILNAPMIIAWLFGMGATEALSYWRAKEPEHGPSYLTTWMILLVPLGLIGTIVLYFAFPIFLSAQTPEIVDIATYFAPVVIMSMLNQICYGALLGAHDYAMFNWVKFLPWAIVAGSYVFLLMIGELGVVSALVANVIGFTFTDLLALLHMHRRHGGYGRATRERLKKSFIYGAKAHGSNVGTIVNARLDLLIMPAFLGAASVGLYSVGTNVSWMVVAIAGAIAPIVLPAAARKDGGGSKVVLDSLIATVAVASILAVGLAIVGYPLIRILYGPEFSSSYMPMVILLPGCVAFAAAQIVWSGLNAEGHPLLAALSQVPGVLITVFGLALLLERVGIDGAAVVSSLAYIASLIAALMLYMPRASVTWADLGQSVRDVRQGASSILRRLREMARGSRGSTGTGAA